MAVQKIREVEGLRAFDLFCGRTLHEGGDAAELDRPRAIRRHDDDLLECLRIVCFARRRLRANIPRDAGEQSTECDPKCCPHAASLPFAFALCVAIRSISGGDRQS